MALNRENKNINYALGRAYGVAAYAAYFDKRAAERLRDNFNKYCEHPKANFATLTKMATEAISKHHLKKELEKEFGEIINIVDDLPDFLTIEDQGTVQMGYYHEQSWLNEQFEK